MAKIRRYDFVVGPETNTALTAGTPSDASDLVTLTYLQTNYNDITEVVTSAQGGTGFSTYTTGDLIYSSATNTLSKRAIGTANQVLTVIGGVPTWATGAGGGGGGSIKWTVDGPLAPIVKTEFNNEVYVFENDVSQYIYCTVKVPETYVAGNQIFMYVSHYHQASSATQLLTALTTLLPHGTAFDDITNQHTSTNSAVAGGNKVLIKAEIDLTDASGEINSVAVSPGDLLVVRLGRGGDTSSDDISMIPSSTEVTFS